MKRILIVLASLAAVSFVALAVFIGPGYLDIRASVNRSKTIRRPELLRRAVLAAETSHGQFTNAFAVHLAKLATIRHTQPSRHLTYHLREMLLSAAISLSYSSDEIISAFMSEVYLGPSVEGVEKGAEVYFGKSTQRMNTAETALLAGLIRSPASYSPLRHPDRAIERRNVVLSRMLANGVIDKSTYASAFTQPLRR